MRYTAFIAATDDFHGTAEDLVEAWQNDHPAIYHHDFDVPDGTSARMVTLLARGLFWEEQWSMDNTVSIVVEDLSPEDTRPLGNNPVGPGTVDRSHDDLTLEDMNPLDNPTWE